MPCLLPDRPVIVLTEMLRSFPAPPGSVQTICCEDCPSYTAIFCNNGEEQVKFPTATLLIASELRAKVPKTRMLVEDAVGRFVDGDTDNTVGFPYICKSALLSIVSPANLTDMSQEPVPRAVALARAQLIEVRFSQRAGLQACVPTVAVTGLAMAELGPNPVPIIMKE